MPSNEHHPRDVVNYYEKKSVWIYEFFFSGKRTVEERRWRRKRGRRHNRESLIKSGFVAREQMPRRRRGREKRRKKKKKTHTAAYAFIFLWRFGQGKRRGWWVFVVESLPNGSTLENQLFCLVPYLARVMNFFVYRIGSRCELCREIGGDYFFFFLYFQKPINSSGNMREIRTEKPSVASRR